LRASVRCESTGGGDAVPAQFYLGQRCVAVLAVLDHWPAPDHAYFKLRGDDGGIYILRHDAGMAIWELTLYDSDCGAERLSST